MAENGTGYADRLLTREEMEAVVDRAFTSWAPAGKRLLFLVPDHTRSCPLDQLFRAVYHRVAADAASVDFLIALGTHPPMSEDRIMDRFGLTVEEWKDRYPKARFYNHAWDDPQQLVEVGHLTRNDISEVSEGRFELDIAVTCNRMIEDYDELIVLGPVFPHEVVGFSGGNKYIFPGISGPEILHFFHWLGAVITNPRIIGNKWTPVRKTVDRAASLLPITRRALCMVVKGEDLAGLYFGSPEEAWSSAADLSAQVHIIYTDRNYHTVLSCAPKMYDELWVGAKCMYKLEPVVADGGTLIIYAPHIKEVAVVHDRLIREIGYHTRDYFLAQWDRFKHHPWGILAHSTHVKGIGTYADGVETPRIEVVLATGISEATCREINLGYRDPASVNADDYRGREDEGVLHVPKAGEMLYRWKDAPPELGGA
jgi:nickel-dependent lactate racemase